MKKGDSRARAHGEGVCDVFPLCLRSILGHSLFPLRKTVLFAASTRISVEQAEHCPLQEMYLLRMRLLLIHVFRCQLRR